MFAFAWNSASKYGLNRLIKENDSMQGNEKSAQLEPKNNRKSRMNRLFCFGLYAVMACFFSACHGGSLSAGDFKASSDIGNSQTGDEANIAMESRAEGGALMLPNPFVNCDSMEEAARLAGFDMVLPKVPDRLEVWKGMMIQVFYGENGKEMLIRKARGSGDISGDYNHYAQVEMMNGITLKGKGNVFFLAVWAKDGYAFSIRVGQALPKADLLALVAVVR